MLFSFRAQLSKSKNLCIIGYSFQDQHVNKFLTEWYSNNTQEKNVMLVDPNLPTNLIGRTLITGGREIKPVTTFWNVFRSGTTENVPNIFPVTLGFGDFLKTWNFSDEKKSYKTKD